MNEYIDRDALRQAVLESQHDNPHPRGMAHIIHDCEHAHFVAMIARFPAADVVPVVHGRWISWEEAGNFVPSPDRHECSVCHDAAQVLVNGLELLSDYCPNCGAKMDGGADNG